MLIKLSPIGVEGNKQPHFYVEFLAHLSRVLAAQENRQPVVGEEWLELVGHSEGDVLPFAAREEYC